MHKSDITRYMILALVILVVAPVSAKHLLQVYLTPKPSEYIYYYQEVLIPAFEALYPDITVELQQGTWYVDTVMVRYIAGNAPDVVQISSLLGTFVEMLAPLDPFISQWHDLRDFPPSLMDNVRMNGHLYAIPWNLGPHAFTYRTDLFAEAGLDPQVAPTTWDDLIAFGRKLTKTDDTGQLVQAGFRTEDRDDAFAPFVYQAGGDFLSQDLRRVTFGEREGVEAADFVRSLFHEYRIADPALGSFSKGKTAMAYTTFEAFTKDSGTYDLRDVEVCLPLTYRRQGQLTVHFSWAIINTSPLQEAAWKWIEFASRLDNIVDLAVYMGDQSVLFPPRLSAVRRAPWAEDPRWRTTFEAVALSMDVPAFKSPHWDVIRKEYIRPFLKRIFYDGQPPTLWEEAQRQANVWLKDQFP